VIERTAVGNDLTLDIALPAALPAPAVLVVHEWWGVNDDIRDHCRSLASAGFLAVAVDLYRGEVARDEARARALAGALDTAQAMRDLTAAVRHLAGDPRAGSIGIIGFCLGGAMALAAAGHVEGLSAAAVFYGLPKARWIDPARVRIPVQGHFGARDASIPSEKPRLVFQTLASGGVDVELHVYDAGHAFLRRGGEAYDEAAATAAWSRLIAFLHRHLGTAKQTL
jgi:carboxymethylenebutenolidase